MSKRAAKKRKATATDQTSQGQLALEPLSIAQSSISSSLATPAAPLDLQTPAGGEVSIPWRDSHFSVVNEWVAKTLGSGYEDEIARFQAQKVQGGCFFRITKHELMREPYSFGDGAADFLIEERDNLPDAHKEVKILSRLGRGGSAVAYAGQFLNPNDVVVKVYHRGEEASYQQETLALRILEPLVPSVPKLLKTDSLLHVCVTSPLGRPFVSSARELGKKAMFTLTCAQQAVQIIAVVHTKYLLIHRDLHEGNMYLHPDVEKVYISDWGSSCQVGSGPMRHAGVLYVCADKVLNVLSDPFQEPVYVPEKSFDLEMIVKSVFKIVYIGAFHKVKESVHSVQGFRAKAVILRDFWRGIVNTIAAPELRSAWIAAFSAAKQNKPSELLTALEELKRWVVGDLV